jgi:hypothetical protein
MTSGFSAFTSSKYYHPAFNSAIFDGPIRIYFVQFHESYALNIYFSLQERFNEALNRYKEIAKKIDQTLLIMIYPTEESYVKAFALTNPPEQMMATVEENKESIFGLLAPITDRNVGQLMDELSDIFIQWEEKSLAEVISSHSNNSSNSNKEYAKEMLNIHRGPIIEAI